MLILFSELILTFRTQKNFTMRFLFFLILASQPAFAALKSDQFVFTIKVVEYNQAKQTTVDLDDCFILVYEDSVSEAGFVSNPRLKNKNELKLTFSLGKNYLVGIGKEEYVRKWITISTKNIPAERLKTPFAQFEMEIELFKEFPGIDYAVLDKPLAAIVYNPDPVIDDFDYDKTYTVQMQPQFVLLKEVMRQTREKQRLYQAAIDEADKLFKASNWQGAKEQYNTALSILPNEKYPNAQVILCEQKLKEAQNSK